MDEPYLISLGFCESWQLGNRDRIKMVRNLARRGDCIHSPIGTYYFNRPDAITHVLQTHADCFVKQHTPYDQMMGALGPGVLTLDGKDWDLSRHRLQSHFTANTIEQSLSRAIPCLMAHLTSQTNEPFDLKPVLHNMVTEAMLHILCDFTSPGLTHSAIEAISLSNLEISRFAPWHRPINKRKKLQKALKTLNKEILENIDKFSSKGLLGPIIEGYQQQQIPTENFLGEMKNFLIAGAETTTSTLAWVIYSITAQPEIWAKISDEIRNNPNPRTWCSPQSPYTQMCIQEAMRLYPSIWTILRRSIKKSTFANITIAKDNFIILSPFTLHRHPAFWTNPEQFDPEHFTPNQKQQRPKGVYIPFGIGKRICIGKQLAMAIMKCILFEWISRYDLSQPDIQHPGMSPLVTLQPKRPIMIRAKALN